MTVQALTAKQRAAIQLSRQRKVTVYEGAVRSAKTITSLVDWIALVRTAPPGRLAIIGKTERTLRNNIIGPLQDMLGKRRVHYNRGLGEITMFGRTILVVGANDERASDKIRGVTLAGAYVDEATILPESFWSMLLTRLSVPGSRLLATTNPDSPACWLKVSYLDRAADHLTGTGTTVEHFPVGWSSSYDIVRNGEPALDHPDAPLDLCRLSFVLDDNPTLDPDYRAFVRSTYTGLWFKRFILGLWVAAEGAIYDMLDEAAHLAPSPSEVGAAWLGIDYGTSNATHAVLLGTDWTNQRLHAIAEWRHDGRAQGSLTDAQLSQRLAEWVAGLKLDHEGITPVLDPSAASLRVQMRNDGWSGLQPANNAVLDGIRAVSTLFAQGRLVIDADACPWLWKELQGYTWDESAQNKGEDKPNKVNDHGCLIAGTQVLTETGTKPIEQIRPGDRVQTRDGLRPVLAAGMTSPDAELWRLETVDGRTLVGTGDHPVWVDGEGWKRLDAARYGDMLSAWPASNPSATTASSTAGIPMLLAHPNAPTSTPGSATGSAATSGSTKTCGAHTMATSRPDITSTTPTMTPTTTSRTTLLPSPRKRTSPITPTTGEASAPTRSTSTWRASVRSLLSGMGHLRVWNGTAGTGGKRGPSGSLSPSPASSAAASTRPSPSTAGNGSAPTTASQPGDGPPASTTSNGPANAAATGSRPTATPRPGSALVAVRSVTRLDSRAAVYNLTVDGSPEFYANGLLVHNCDALRYAVMAAYPVWRNWTGSPLSLAAAA